MNTNTSDTDDDTGEASLQLPTKTIDRSESLDDRLTDNVRQQIGPARYFMRDEDGNPVEDWDGVFSRVAQNVAIGTAVFHDIPISVSRDHLADWVDTDERDELFGDTESQDTDERDELFGDTEYRDLDEAVAPYVDDDALAELLESAPGDLADDFNADREAFESAMREQRFMPNSPTLMNAGTELQQLSACFVRIPDDSMVEDGEYRSIMGAAQDAAAIFKSGGGIGYPFHLLRPKGARVSSTGGVSSGPMSFMQIYDTVCDTVKQGGKRRGAQMGIMHVQHPDIGRFCVSKRGEDNLTNFNISAGLTDEFLDAVESGDQFTLVDPTTGWPNPDPFEVVPETAHFYDPQFEDAWNDEYDKPGLGLDGKKVESNFWRDHLEDMQDPEAFEQYRHEIDLEVGEPMELPAGFIWQLIVDGAHNKGEPGFVHLDEINREHSFDVIENPEHLIHSTNPCSEQPLEDGEACNLGHVNLSLMVDEDAQPFDQWLEGNLPDHKNFLSDEHVDAYLEHALDTELLDETTATGTKFLENVVTMSKFPLEEIEDQVHAKRKIGLGLMGFHQMLLQLGVEYGSRPSIAIAERVMKRLDRVATETSHELALERGVFEEYDESKWSDPAEYPEWVAKHAHVDPDEYPDGYAMRNHNATTIAPTGTTSMIGDTTGGCEPLYNVAFFKNVGDDIQGDEMLVEFDDYFLQTLEANGISPDVVREEAQEKMATGEFDSVDDLDAVPDDIGELFVTAEDLEVDDHINVQAAFQKYCDSAISKTLNMANDVAIDEVGDAIATACRKGIKGATIYRVGSRQKEVKTTSVTGGGVTISESDTENLVDELLERLEDESIDDETRGALITSLDLASTNVAVEAEQPDVVNEVSD